MVKRNESPLLGLKVVSSLILRYFGKMKALLILSLFTGVFAQAESNCFDPSKPNPPLLHPSSDRYEEGKDPSDYGTDEKKNDWAQVSGVVHKSVQDLYQKLLNPKTIRNGSNTKVVVDEVETKDFLKHTLQKITVKPVFFITIDWKEDWLYTLKDGTATDPKGLIVSYQKIEGTSHIKHLCGNIVLTQLGPNYTGVYLYEEVQADRRSAQDVLSGISGTLRTLRE